MSNAPRPNKTVHPEAAWDAYVYVEEIEKLQEEYQAKGVKLAEPLHTTVYQMKEFQIEDCNGFGICFGQDVHG